MYTIIRSAEPADAETLKAISRRTICANYKSFLGDEAVEGYIAGGAPDRYVEEHIGDCSVIGADGAIAGFCVCRGNMIDLMMIDHQFHRKGIGTLLLAHCERILFETRDELKLESFQANKQADNFYRKNGWVQSESYFDKVSGARKIVFRKRA